MAAPARKPRPAATATPDPAEKVPASTPAAKPEPPAGEPEKQDLSGLEQLEAEAAAGGEPGAGESVAGEMTAKQERDQQAEADEAAARAGAAMAYGFCETVLKMRFPYIEIPGEQRHQIIEKATPVMRKYGAELPAWLKPYQEEIELGMTLAATGFGVYMQVQQHRKEQARQAQQGRRRQAGTASAAAGDRPSPFGRVDLSTEEAAEDREYERFHRESPDYRRRASAEAPEEADAVPA